MTDATSAGSYDDTDDSGESGESELRRARERYAPGRALFLLLLGFVLLLPLPLARSRG